MPYHLAIPTWEEIKGKLFHKPVGEGECYPRIPNPAPPASVVPQSSVWPPMPTPELPQQDAPQVDPTEAAVVDGEASVEGIGLPLLGAIPPHGLQWPEHFLQAVAEQVSVPPESAAPAAQEIDMATAPVVTETPKPESEAKKIEQEFVGVLETIGKDFEKGLTIAVKYLPAAASLAAFIFPPAVSVLTPAISTADLLQKAISAAEQQYAAMNQQNGTGAQKAATVLTVVESAVTTLLADPTVKAGLAAAHITVSAAYIQNLINCVVAILNVQAPNVP